MGEEPVSWELLPSDVMAPGSGLFVNPSPMAPLATRPSALFIQPQDGVGRETEYGKGSTKVQDLLRSQGTSA